MPPAATSGVEVARKAEFSGLADLLHAKADRYPSGPIAEEGDWPAVVGLGADVADHQTSRGAAESAIG